MSTDLLKLQPAWLDAQRPRMGRYVLGPLLGKGGMGEVLEGWDVVLCRTVALKILRNVEPTAVIRFMHEAQVHARVAHPNICRVYDVDVSDNTVMIAMQLVRGMNLDQARGDLTTEEAVTLMAQVAEGIHAAHRLKLIHRDLKPSNILLERGDDGRWVPYVCDFGLAMAMDEPAFTASNGIIGTPAYMAPEQFRGDRSQIGPATDIYCLGGTLHYLMYGRPPGGSLVTAGSPAVKRTIELPTNREIPRDLRNIIIKCLQPEPGLRYGTAGSLAEDLWSYLNGEKVHATLPGPVARLWHRAQPQLAVALPFMMGMTGLIAGTLATWLYLGRVNAANASLLGRFSEEARELELDLGHERALPLHDLRPALARVRSRIQVLGTEVASLGADAAGPGHLALARTRLLLRQYPEARKEAEEAWAKGRQGPECARVLATARAMEATLGDSTPPAPDPGRLEELFRKGRSLTSSGDSFGQALTANLRGDHFKASSEAMADALARPWRVESVALGCASLWEMARSALEGGDLPGAQARFQEALGAARRCVEVAQSDTLAHHTVLGSARGLAGLQLDQGQLDLDTLAGLEAQCARAQALDPDDPELQDDWLALRILKVLRLADLGKDPSAELDEAVIYQGTRLREPLPRALRTDRMAVLWLQARSAFIRGEDPGPTLAEALKVPDPATFLYRDLRREVLVFKARTEAARGVDPSATLDEALSRVPATAHPSWTASQSACEAWMVRARWQAAHGGDATGSLRRARLLINGAQQVNPGSARGRALAAECRTLETDLREGRP